MKKTFWHTKALTVITICLCCNNMYALSNTKEAILPALTDTKDQLDYATCNNPHLLKTCLDTILITHKAQLAIAQAKWDTGVTSTMNQGNQEMIDYYKEVLIKLSAFYPKGHFNNLTPEKYFDGVISESSLWNKIILEPLGTGTGGTVVSIIAGGNVMNDLKKKIAEMVSSLVLSYGIENPENLHVWKEEWMK